MEVLEKLIGKFNLFYDRCLFEQTAKTEIEGSPNASGKRGSATFLRG